MKNFESTKTFKTNLSEAKKLISSENQKNSYEWQRNN